jgi:hypothetical protein
MPPYGSLRPRQVVVSHFRHNHTSGLARLFYVVQYSEYSVMLVLRKSTCVAQVRFFLEARVWWLHRARLRRP